MRTMRDDGKDIPLSEPPVDPVGLLMCAEDQSMHFISKVRTFHLVLTSSGGCLRVEMSKKIKIKKRHPPQRQSISPTNLCIHVEFIHTI